MTAAAGPRDGGDVALAGEYALGLLTPADVVAFERRLDGNPALRGVLAAWQEHLAGLLAHVPAVVPPPRVRDGVTRRLFPGAVAATPSRPWLRALTALLGGAAVAASLVLTVPQVLPVAHEHVATVAAEDGSLRVVAAYDVDSATLRVRPEAGTARPGRALELWLIAEALGPPVSLGVLPQGRATTLRLPARLADVLAGATLAVSDEPLGGSPTGRPTGEVLAAGPVTPV